MKSPLLQFFVSQFCFHIAYGVLEYDYQYINSINGEMKLHQVPNCFDNARLFCSIEGGILASPENENMVRAMKEIMRKQSRPLILTGVTSLLAGVFISGNGVPLSQLPVEWAAGEPDNLMNSEKCLVMNLNGKVSDKRCDEVFSFICFRNKKMSTPINRKSSPSCGRNDYVYVGGDGKSCYKYHKDIQTFKNAYLTCYFEGGYLVTINSGAEARALVDLIKEFGHNSKFPYAFIGIKDWNGEKNWLTIFGEDLQSAGYAKWAPGEPNNGNSKHVLLECCGAIMKNGYLNDVSCFRKAPFICERKKYLQKPPKNAIPKQTRKLVALFYDRPATYDYGLISSTRFEY